MKGSGCAPQAWCGVKEIDKKLLRVTPQAFQKGGKLFLCIIKKTRERFIHPSALSWVDYEGNYLLKDQNKTIIKNVNFTQFIAFLCFVECSDGILNLILKGDDLRTIQRQQYKSITNCKTDTLAPAKVPWVQSLVPRGEITNYSIFFPYGIIWHSKTMDISKVKMLVKLWNKKNRF